MAGAPAAQDLVGFVSSMGGERALRVEENLGEGFVRLRVAEAERRQAKHDVRCIEDVVIEMLRNARDAHASHIYVATVYIKLFPGFSQFIRSELSHSLGLLVSIITSFGK